MLAQPDAQSPLSWVVIVAVIGGLGCTTSPVPDNRKDPSDRGTISTEADSHAETDNTSDSAIATGLDSQATASTEISTHNENSDDGDNCPSMEETKELYQQWRETCAAQTTKEGCQDAAAILPSLGNALCCEDCGHTCYFEEFTLTAVESDGSCSTSATSGSCFYGSTGGEGGRADLLQEQRYCTGLAGNPLYVSSDAGVGLAISPFAPHGGDTVQMCLFSVKGGEPAECDCLCSYPKDERLQCDADNGTCLDLVTRLMWQRVVPSNAYDNPSGAADICEHSTLASYFDWRQPTLQDLRGLLRGCAQNEPNGTCGLNNLCQELSCAEAGCSRCNSPSGESLSCPGPDCPNPNCTPCAAFGSGPCAACERDRGPGYQGLYLPWELEWPSYALLSADPPHVFPGSTGPITRVWAIDPRLGAPVLTELGAAVCVRGTAMLP